jgi:hypothetical protein
MVKKNLNIKNKDAIQMCHQRRCEEYENFVLRNMKSLIKTLLHFKPNLKIASLGYDLLSWERSETCVKLFKFLFREMTFKAFREQFISRFTRIHQEMEKEFPKNFFYVPVWGNF